MSTRPAVLIPTHRSRRHLANPRRQDRPDAVRHPLRQGSPQHPHQHLFAPPTRKQPLHPRGLVRQRLPRQRHPRLPPPKLQQKPHSSRRLPGRRDGRNFHFLHPQFLGRASRAPGAYRPSSRRPGGRSLGNRRHRVNGLARHRHLMHRNDGPHLPVDRIPQRPPDVMPGRLQLPKRPRNRRPPLNALRRQRAHVLPRPVRQAEQVGKKPPRRPTQRVLTDDMPVVQDRVPGSMPGDTMNLHSGALTPGAIPRGVGPPPGLTFAHTPGAPPDAPHRNVHRIAVTERQTPARITHSGGAGTHTPARASGTLAPEPTPEPAPGWYRRFP